MKQKEDQYQVTDIMRPLVLQSHVWLHMAETSERDLYVYRFTVHYSRTSRKNF